MKLDWNILHFFQEGNALMLAGAVLIALALLLLARLLAATVESMSRRKLAAARRRRLGFSQFIFRLLVLLVIGFAGISAGFAGLTARTYVAFTRADQIGILECLAWNPAEKMMVVNFTTLTEGKKTGEQSYSLYGDQWEISAHILKWDPKVNLLGLHTSYRLHQIKGSYFSAEDESTGKHKAYALASGQDWMWWFISRYGEKLPLVEAVYGNAVSRLAKPGERFDVFVTTSGLSARRRNQ